MMGAVSVVVKSSDRLRSDPRSFTSWSCYLGQIIVLPCHNLRRCKMEINNNNPLHRIDVYMKQVDEYSVPVYYWGGDIKQRGGKGGRGGQVCLYAKERRDRERNHGPQGEGSCCLQSTGR